MMILSVFAYIVAVYLMPSRMLYFFLKFFFFFLLFLSSLSFKLSMKCFVRVVCLFCFVVCMFFSALMSKEISIIFILCLCIKFPYRIITVGAVVGFVQQKSIWINSQCHYQYTVLSLNSFTVIHLYGAVDDDTDVDIM